MPSFFKQREQHTACITILRQRCFCLRRGFERKGMQKENEIERKWMEIVMKIWESSDEMKCTMIIIALQQQQKSKKTENICIFKSDE